MLALIAMTGTAARAQTVTADLFSPTRASQVTSPDSPLRRTAAEANDPLNSPKLQDNDTNKPAPSRIGQIPKYGLPAASGAADSGYDLLNRKRKKPKYYPGQAKPKPPVGPGSPPPPIASNTRCGCRSRRRRPPTRRRMPPAMAGTVVGQPPRKRLRVDDDPFGAVGDYAGSFLIKSAVEFSGGYDTNPGRTRCRRKASPFYVIAPEFVAFSDWERHALVADLRGSFTGYGSNLHAERRRHALVGAGRYRPAGFHRPCRRPARCQPRHPAARRRRGCASRPTIPAARTCRPASPDIRSTRRSAAPSASTRISTACRFPPAPPSTAPTTPTRNSPTARRASNDDRNFNQYGGVGRVSYDLRPGLKPFVEVEGDSRVHDVRLDRSGYERNSAAATSRPAPASNSRGC